MSLIFLFKTGEPMQKTLEDWLIDPPTHDRIDFIVGKYELSKKDKLLREIAQTYHDQTEAYDKQVCTARSKYDNCATPANKHQYRLIQENAFNTLNRLYEEHKGKGILKSDIKEAIQKYNFERK